MVNSCSHTKNQALFSVFSCLMVPAWLWNANSAKLAQACRHKQQKDSAKPFYFVVEISNAVTEW